MFAWIKKNKHGIVTAISLILNVLGGAGLIPPVVGKAVAGAVAGASAQ